MGRIGCGWVVVNSAPTLTDPWAVRPAEWSDIHERRILDSFPPEDRNDLATVRAHVAQGRQCLWAILHQGAECGTLLTASAPPVFCILALGSDLPGCADALVRTFRYLARLAGCDRIRAYVSTEARRRLFLQTGDGAKVIEWVIEWPG